MSVLGWEDLDPEEDARRARAREAYAKMYPLTDDPYGEKRLEQVQTPAGIKRVFNQVARERGLGAFVDAQDSEPSRTLEPREVDRSADLFGARKHALPLSNSFVIKKRLIKGVMSDKTRRG